MVPIKTKEHLVYFMQCGMLRLSRYDLHFIQNLQNLILTKNSITTNQVALFEKIVEKYNRQLTKHGLIKSNTDQLSWETEIVNSDKKFTEAYLSLKEDTIYFKSPFSKKFLEKFSKQTYNSFKWVREYKHYEAPYSTHALKFLIELAKDFYPKINYCPTITGLINSVERFNAKYWEPTLIYLNGRYIIVAITEALYNAIIDIELSNNPECLSLLAAHGITIDDSIINNDPLLRFASEYSTVVDYSNVDDFIDYLHAIKCDSVFVAGLVLSHQYKTELINKIKEKASNIQIDDRSSLLLSERLKGKNNPVVIYMLPKSITNIPGVFKKIIRITNGVPIHII